ncbi:MAG: hypothetical protein ACHRXM_08160 [Isosphaerales bacterium]
MSIAICHVGSIDYHGVGVRCAGHRSRAPAGAADREQQTRTGEILA